MKKSDGLLIASMLSDDFVEYDDQFRFGDFTFLKSEYFLYECTGRQQRAIPGDVIAVKPVGQAWTSHEKKEFLMIDIDDLEQSQVAAICESEMDLDSYKLYAPMEYGVWLSMMQLKNLSKVDSVKADALLTKNSELWYPEYLLERQESSSMPKDHWRKRRFNIDLVTLENAGVDTTIMLNKGVEYAPKVRTFYPDEVYDKLKECKIDSEYNLELMAPRTLEEMLEPSTSEETLGEIR